MIVSKTILDSIEYITFKKGKSPWTKSSFGTQLLELEVPAESKISRHLFLLFE